MIRILQNSFDAGELAPELYARHDLQAYFQGAARIRNFIVRRTGGARKRAGTQYLTHFDKEGTEGYRVVPFLFDRLNYALIVLSKAAADTNMRWALVKVTPGGVSVSEGMTVAAQITDAAELMALNYKQLGDTVYFSSAGKRSFKAEVFFDLGSMEWKQVTGVGKPAAAPALSVKTENFQTGAGYVKSKRKYALWGVRDGVNSALTEKEVDIYLEWTAGARVILEFTPRWDRHDHYVLGKLQGANYGRMAEFWPDWQTGGPADATWQNVSVSASAEYGGVAYIAGTQNIAAEWRKSADTLSELAGADAAYHTGAAIVDGVVLCETVQQVPVLALRVWFGGRLRKSGAEAEVAEVSSSGMAKLALLYAATAGDVEVAEWDVNLAYSEAPVTLVVETPVAPADGKSYKLRFTLEQGQAVPVVRGIVLVTNQAVQRFIDDNIAVVDVAGLQDRLTVGDGGMDCDIVDMWEQRLVMAASRGMPFSVWFSAVGNLESFYTERPQTMADAFSVSIPPTAASRILHMFSGQWLMFWTESGEYQCSGSSDGFGYATVNFKKTSSVGAHPDIKPVATETHLLFVSADACGVYEMRYDLASDNIVPQDRAIYARHLTETAQITKTAFQRFPDSVLWCLLADGTLAAMTYMPQVRGGDPEVIAWTRHDIAAPEGMKLVDIVCPGTMREGAGIETTSEVVLVWEDTENPGALYLERMRAQAAGDTPDKATALCRDHMGYPAEVMGGEAAERRIEAEIDTLRPESPEFHTGPLPKAAFDCAVRVRRSGTVAIKPLRGALRAQKSAVPAEGDDSVVLFSGDLKVLPLTYWDDAGQMNVSSADDWPCEIQSLLCHVEVGNMTYERDRGGDSGEDR